MLDVYGLWLQYPSEIEADLKFRGIDIGAWHRLDRDAHGCPILSSRLLLVLLEELDEDSSFKKARSSSGWSERQHMMAETANVLNKILVSYRSAHGAKHEAPNVFFSPTEKAALAIENRLDQANDVFLEQERAKYF